MVQAGEVPSGESTAMVQAGDGGSDPSGEKEAGAARRGWSW